MRSSRRQVRELQVWRQGEGGEVHQVCFGQGQVRKVRGQGQEGSCLHEVQDRWKDVRRLRRQGKESCCSLVFFSTSTQLNPSSNSCLLGGFLLQRV